MPLPKTICTELLDELNGYVGQNQVPDPFTLARLKRQIKTLMNSSPADAYLCHGILHTLNKDIQGVRDSFKQVFFHLPNDSDMHYNFAGSLLRLGFANESLDHFMQALACNRASRAILLEIVNAAHVTFRMDTLLNAMDMYVRASQDESIMDDQEVQGALEIASILQELEIAPTTINGVYQAAESVLVKFSKTIERVRLLESKNLGGSLISVYAGIQTDPETISAMNMDLADELIDRDLADLAPSVSYAFTPA